MAEAASKSEFSDIKTEPQLQDPSALRCAYIDFVPEQIGTGGTFSTPKYPAFSALLVPANQWLATNPQLEVITCESCEIKVDRGHQVENDTTFFLESGNASTSFIRLLRYYIGFSSFYIYTSILI